MFQTWGKSTKVSLLIENMHSSNSEEVCPYLQGSLMIENKLPNMIDHDDLKFLSGYHIFLNGQFFSAKMCPFLVAHFVKYIVTRPLSMVTLMCFCSG